MKLLQKENHNIAWVYQNSLPQPPGLLYFLYKINTSRVKTRLTKKRREY